MTTKSPTSARSGVRSGPALADDGPSARGPGPPDPAQHAGAGPRRRHAREARHHHRRDALWYLPFRYDDFSDLRPLGELVPDEKQSARVRVEAVRVEPGFGRRPQRVIAQLSDDDRHGRGDLVRAALRRAPAAGQGDEVIVSGKVTLAWAGGPSSPRPSSARSGASRSTRRASCRSTTSQRGVTQRRLRELLATDHWSARCPALRIRSPTRSAAGCRPSTMPCEPPTSRRMRPTCPRRSTGSPSTSCWPSS